MCESVEEYEELVDGIVRELHEAPDDVLTVNEKTICGLLVDAGLMTKVEVRNDDGDVAWNEYVAVKPILCG